MDSNAFEGGGDPFEQYQDLLGLLDPCDAHTSRDRRMHWSSDERLALRFWNITKEKEKGNTFFPSILCGMITFVHYYYQVFAPLTTVVSLPCLEKWRYQLPNGKAAIDDMIDMLRLFLYRLKKLDLWRLAATECSQAASRHPLPNTSSISTYTFGMMAGNLWRRTFLVDYHSHHLSRPMDFSWCHLHALLRSNDRRNLSVALVPYYDCHISDDIAFELLQLFDGGVKLHVWNPYYDSETGGFFKKKMRAELDPYM